jgi:hypothetical protein
MKSFFLMLTLSVVPVILADKKAWTSVSAEEQEIRDIMQNVQRIKEQFTAMGASRSSACQGAIFGYLKQVGTPASLKALKMLIQNGELPQHFLSMA